jgi:hypothetical protein
MAIKRKRSFVSYVKGDLPNHNAQQYAKKINLTKAEKDLLVEYLNGYVAITALTAPLLAKMRVYTNHKYQFDRTYALELVALNLSERNQETLAKMYKESTLKGWLTEFSLISNDMQHVYADEFGVSIFENSQLPTVTGIVQRNKGKGRKAAEVVKEVQGAKELKMLREHVAPVMAPPGLSHEEMEEGDEETGTSLLPYQKKEPPLDEADVASYFSKHAMKRTGKKLTECFDEMLAYHNDNVPYLFKEFAKSPLAGIMADFWSQSFEFDCIEHKGNDNVLRVSCRHFDVIISRNEMTFVDKWDLGEVAYTIPVSEDQPSRMEQAEYFFQTWDIRRAKSVLQAIGFRYEDELMLAGKPLYLKSVASGPQAILCMDIKARPCSWDGAEYTIYSTLCHMLDGVRGCLMNTDSSGEMILDINGVSYETVRVSNGGVIRYVMRGDDAVSFMEEYTDHMGWHDSADELRERGFALDLNKERAVLTFNNDQERPCEIIVYC